MSVLGYIGLALGAIYVIMVVAAAIESWGREGDGSHGERSFAVGCLFAFAALFVWVVDFIINHVRIV